MLAATATWPGCGRMAWMRASNGRDDPCSGGHHLGAVDQRQAVLGGQLDRFQASARQRVGCRFGPGAVRPPAAARADQGQGHVGQRCEVAGRADAAAAGHEGHDAVPVQGQHLFEHGDRDAGLAQAQGVDLQSQHQASDVLRQRVAGAAGVGEQQILLQLRQLVGRDPLRRQRTEARIDAVDACLAVEHRVDVGP